MDRKFITDPKKIKTRQNWNKMPGSLTTNVSGRPVGMRARGFFERILGR